LDAITKATGGNKMIIPKPREKQAPQPMPMPPQKDEPGKLLYDNGILMLTEKFDSENVSPLIARIVEYNLMEDPPEEITLYINSPGGRVDACFHLVDTMKQSRIPVNTVAMGLAASCGLITLMAGAKRYATQNTELMSHQYSGMNGGKEHELEAAQKSFELVSERVTQHYMKCTGKSRTYVRKNLLPKSDVYMSGEEAIKHGIIDEVIWTY
jgi:ATP-dependent Clp protease protease subunit